MNENAIQKLERATQMLAECRSPLEAKKIADLAAAAGEYAKRAKLGLEAERYAAEIRIDALTRMGELLQATPKAKPPGSNQYAKKEDRFSQGIEAPTLKSVGITLKESQQAQALAKAKKDIPELHAAARNGEVSPKQVAKEMAKPKNLTDEERVEYDRKCRERIDTARFAEVVQLLVVGNCATEQGREALAKSFRIQPLNFPPRDISEKNFSPITMAIAADNLGKLATI